ncbi:hypothetical protein ACTXG5_25525 [Mycobacterium sp. Dal123C01]|uniref:hypothetical protein n=1 Tax=Mycobacterium sp. Dal123C01 TaxID=3457577 RepID=UPI00403ED32F
MITNSRQIIAQANAQLRSQGKAPDDSPAQLFGPHGEHIPSDCEAYLEANVSGSTLGSRPQLPLNFSSADFLKGCNDGGNAMLASGH